MTEEQRIEAAAEAMEHAALTSGRVADSTARDMTRLLVEAAVAAYLAGDVVAPKVATDKMVCAALDDWDDRKRRGVEQTYGNIWQAMMMARAIESARWPQSARSSEPPV